MRLSFKPRREYWGRGRGGCSWRGWRCTLRKWSWAHSTSIPWPGGSGSERRTGRSGRIWPRETGKKKYLKFCWNVKQNFTKQNHFNPSNFQDDKTMRCSNNGTWLPCESPTKMSPASEMSMPFGYLVTESVLILRRNCPSALTTTTLCPCGKNKCVLFMICFRIFKKSSRFEYSLERTRCLKWIPKIKAKNRLADKGYYNLAY